MTEPAAKLSHTFAEYVALEAASETKHEFVNGEIFAMAGGTPEHSRLSANVIGELRAALRGRPCVTFTSDLRIRVQTTGLGTYPDASVVCGQLEVDPEDKNSVTNPVVLVEVLADSTEAYDRDDKRAHYRLIPSLCDYLLVSQRERRIDHYHRNDDGTWTLRDVRAGGEVRLDSVGCHIAVDAVYDDPLATVTAPTGAPAVAPPRSRPKRASRRRA
jgi:Uma2 family endonuclease